MREVLYNILIEFCIPMKLVRLIKMCLIEHIAESNICLTCFLLRMVCNEGMLEGLKLNGTHRILVYANDVNICSINVHTIRKNTDALRSC